MGWGPGGVLPAGAVVRLDGDAWKMGEWTVAPLGHEPTNHQGSMLDVAESMKGVPYHWGGRSSWGLDCSGLVQLAAMLTGRLVPRDASQQAEVGVEVHSNDLQDNDVAFFANDKGSHHACRHLQSKRRCASRIGRSEGRPIGRHLAGSP